MSRFLEQSEDHKPTDVWFSSPMSGGQIKSFKWEYESDKHLHQSSGYRTPKKGACGYWFKTFKEAKDYSMIQLQEKLKRSKSSYENDLRSVKTLADCKSI